MTNDDLKNNSADEPEEHNSVESQQLTEPVFEHEAEVGLIPAGDFDEELEPVDTTQAVPYVMIGSAAGMVVGFVLVAMLYGWFFGLLPNGVFAGLVVFVILFSAFYGWQVLRTMKRRTATELKQQIPCDIRFTWVSERTLQRLRHVLSVDSNMPDKSERYIYLVTRMHKVGALVAVSRPLVVLLAYMAFTAWLAAVSGPFASWVSEAFIIGLAVISGWLLYSFQSWRDTYLIMTDRNILIVVQHPAWLWWMKGSTPRLPLSDVNFSRSEDQSWLGNICGYGILVVDGFSQLDVNYNKLKFTPRHDSIATLISMYVSD